VWQRVDFGFGFGVGWDTACIKSLLAHGFFLGVYAAFATQNNLEEELEGKHTQASKRINTINVHRTTPTNSLSATPSEGERRINLILNPNQRIQYHRTRLIQIQRVALHSGLGGWLIGVPAVDVEGLDSGLWIMGRLFDRTGFSGRNSA